MSVDPGLREESVAGSAWVGRGRRWTLLALLALVVCALALRLTGLAFMLPHTWEPDSLVFVRQVEYIENRADEAQKDVFYGYYPHLIPRLCTLMPASLPRVAPATLEEHLRAASANRLRIRRLIALLSVLIVPGTWLLARRFLPPPAALFAAGLMATSVLHIWFAQETRPHGLSSAFALLAVVAALRLRERGDLLSYALAGFTTLLAVCSLQNGVAVLLPLTLAHLLRTRGALRHPHLAFALVLAATAIGVRVFYPFMFEATQGHDAAVLGIEGESLNLSGHGIQLSAFDGQGFPVVVEALLDYEPLITAAVFVGLVLACARWLARRRVVRVAHDAPASHGPRAWLEGREDLAVVLAYVVPYFLVIGMYAHSYARFAIPLLPYCACFAAWAVFGVCDRFVSWRRAVPGGEALAHLVAVVLFLAQAWAAVKLVAIRTQPDTARRAADWIAAHLEPGRDRIVHSPSLDLPLLRTKPALAAFSREVERAFPWIVYQRQMSGDLAARQGYDLRSIPMQGAGVREDMVKDAARFVSSLGADYAVIEDFTSNVRPYNERVRLGLSEVADLVARFSPMWVDTGDDRPLAYQDDSFERRPIWWARVILARSMGPAIEIYRLRK